MTRTKIKIKPFELRAIKFFCLFKDTRFSGDVEQLFILSMVSYMPL